MNMAEEGRNKETKEARKAKTRKEEGISLSRFLLDFALCTGMKRIHQDKGDKQ